MYFFFWRKIVTFKTKKSFNICILNMLELLKERLPSSSLDYGHANVDLVTLPSASIDTEVGVLLLTM